MKNATEQAMSNTVKLSGTYRGQFYEDIEVRLVTMPKHGAKGWFVQVDGRGVDELPQQVFKLSIDEDAANKLMRLPPAGMLQTKGEEPEEVETTETDQEITTRIVNRFGILRKMTEGSVTGAIRSLIVSGAGGVGKSFAVEEVLEKADAASKVNFTCVKGGLSPVNLYKLMFDYSDSHSVIVLDDCDSILFDEEALNLLKGALDTTGKRHISWMKESAALGDTPTDFTFNGTMIFITNIDFQRIVDEEKSKLAPHFEALLTRSLYLDLTLRTKRELVCWISHIVRNAKMLAQKGLSVKQSEEVLDFLKANLDRLRTISLRAALQAADLVLMDPRNWQETAAVVMLRNR
jgi:hypothetical protein